MLGLGCRVLGLGFRDSLAVDLPRRRPASTSTAAGGRWLEASVFLAAPGRDGSPRQGDAQGPPRVQGLRERAFSRHSPDGQIAPPNWHASFQKVPLSGECRENVGRKVSQSRNASPNFLCDDLNEFLALLIAETETPRRQRQRALLPAAAGRGCVRAKLHLQRDHYSAVAIASAAASAHAGTVLSGACRGTAPSPALRVRLRCAASLSCLSRMLTPRIEGWVYTSQQPGLA